MGIGQSNPGARKPAFIGAIVAVLSMSVLAHDHRHHRSATSGQPDAYTRTTAGYVIPDVKLVDANGVEVALGRHLESETKPILLNFIYTSCGAVCPVMSATFAQLQADLGAQRSSVRMMSISIDPEHDTPVALKAYARQYGAGPQWQMLTGSLADSVAVQRAFGVFRGDKMSHQPATFLRAGPKQPWVRLDGFASAAEILREYRQLRTH